MTKGLRIAAVAEALTLLALVFVAVPLKYGADLPAAASIMGPIHGMAFMLFLWFVIRSLSEELINWKGAVRLLVGAVIPFGGIVNERWLKRRFSKKMN